MADVPVAIVGAGVVGLAVAARLARRFPGLVVLERHPRPGTETSSRNSEVVHAGIYYPPGSLKATLCVEGNALLRQMASEHGLPFRAIGKLIVAAEAGEEPALAAIAARARACGVPVEPLGAAAAAKLEPSVRCTAGLLSPTTAIMSAHGLVNLLRAHAAAAGADILTQARVVAIEPVGGGFRLAVARPGGIEVLVAERVVDAAGLDADAVASMAGIDVVAAGYGQHWAKGSYFAAPSLSDRLSRLVYPVPGADSLGIHAVVDLGGRVRFGPDIEYLPDRRMALQVDPSRREAFGASVRRYLPQLRDGDLVPDMAGIRPKLQGPGEPFRDFVIHEESARGLPGLVTLAGIESPGLTAAPAIARMVDELLP